MQSENPQLLIVGGPNGAGKSTYSGGLSAIGAFVFDADIITARMKVRFPDVTNESIYYAVQAAFLDNVEEAIDKKQHFTIETNFRDNELMNTIALFKQKGYDTSMIFLLLNNVELSIERVKQRISTGGHFVDEGSIRYNFEEGLKNLEYFAGRFDNLDIIDSSADHGQVRLLLSLKQQQLVYLSDDLPISVQQMVTKIAGRFRGYPRHEDNDEDKGRSYKRGR